LLKTIVTPISCDGLDIRRNFVRLPSGAYQLPHKIPGVTADGEETAEDRLSAPSGKGNFQDFGLAWEAPDTGGLSLLTKLVLSSQSVYLLIVLKAPNDIL